MNFNDNLQEHWHLFFRKVQYSFWSTKCKDEELRQSTMLEFWDIIMKKFFNLEILSFLQVSNLLNKDVEILDKNISSVSSIEVVELLNSILNNKKLFPNLYLDKGILNSKNPSALQIFLNTKKDIFYNLKKRKFVSFENSSCIFLIPFDNIFDPKYFFKNIDLWKKNGVKEQDIDFASEITDQLLNVKIVLYKNLSLSSENFESLMWSN